ncbi:MAG TPA: hypothetical protein PKU97_10450 [Kofleriaceae bacterium]|nr:hypothetical protein [Kofleriaceae bacterium]
MAEGSSHQPASLGPSIWWWALGYFTCYVPYSSLTKALSKPLVDTGDGPVGSLELLPPTVMASVATTILFLLVTGWWRLASRHRVLGLDLPGPRRLTVISGLCSSGIIATTTLAYTFSGVSLVLVALLMRGGVLVLAPIVDRITGRRVRWFSWIALGLSLLSLLSAFSSSWRDTRMPVLAALDIALYLGCYFARLTLMSHNAKADHDTNRRYFVEEIMVSSVSLLLALAVAAVVVGGPAGQELRAGFTTFFDRPVWGLGVLVGVMSQGTGIFGGLIFLDSRESSYCVPVNRASSVLAVLAASVLLAALASASWPSPAEWAGAGLILLAIGVLTLAPAWDQRRKTRKASEASA